MFSTPKYLILGEFLLKAIPPKTPQSLRETLLLSVWLPHLNESIVRTGCGLEEVGQHVGADSVVLDTERLQAGVLVQGGAEGLYCEVAQLEI